MSENFSVICDQRMRRLVNNVPPVRFELVSPYTSGRYTQRDLDMRRKAEILQYSSSKMSTQTNSLTKKQKWALIARGNFPTPPTTYQPDPVSGDLVPSTNCPADDMLLVPTSSSDVPGKPINLYLDKSVPLYNYGSPQRSYPFNVNINTSLWRISTGLDILLPHNEEDDLFTMSINNNIDQPTYNYTVRFPVSLFVMGVIQSNNINKTIPITLSIYSITLNIYYSNNLVKSVGIPPTLSSLVVNVGGKTGEFSANQYVGTVSSTSIRLFTEPGYIYDAKLIFRISITGGGSNYFSTIKAYAYANATLTTTKENNCVVVSTPSLIPNGGFSLFSS